MSGPGPTPNPTPGGEPDAGPTGRRDDLLISGAGPALGGASPQILAGEGGRFLLLGELGRGAMGVVHRARDLGSGREVALKLLREALSPQRLIRFRREGELTARLSHPGIVRVHSSGVVDGKPFLAYELVEDATTLSEAFRRLGPLERTRLVRDACRALGHAHEMGVVHRDVKPDNVLVDRANGVHVADFGLAAAQDVERLTVTGVLVGTPTFMPPEQLEGRHADVGRHSDVWSLGVMLYLALTGEHPFPADTLLQLIDLVSSRDPAPPRSLDPSIPPSLEAVCLKALARDPAERYPDANAMAADLDLALSGERPGASGAARWRLPAPRRLLAGLSVAGAMVLLVAVILTAATATPGVSLEWTHEPPATWGGDRPLLLAGRLRGDLRGTTLAVDGSPAALDALGSFAVELSLPDGAHTITVVASRGERELWRQSWPLQVDRTPPALAWPVEPEPTQGERGRLSGLVHDDGEWVELLVDDDPPVRVAPGAFSIERGLRIGPNLAQVVARDAWGNASPPSTVALWRVPAWWAELAPPPARPRVPLPAGLSFGEEPGQYINGKDGSLLRWIPPPPPEPQRQQRLLIDGDVVHQFEDGFFMGQSEVTWSQYERFCQDTGRARRRPAYDVGPTHPVHHVSWQDAADYCEWAGLRLPREVEWELAARGPHGPPFPWGSQAEPADGAQRGNFLDPSAHPDGFEYSAPVGSFPLGRSPYGCVDMAGNVFEWVQDWFGAPPVSDSPLVGWAGPPTGEKRVLKGGGFDQPIGNCGVGKRFADAPERALPHTGFRVAR